MTTWVQMSNFFGGHIPCHIKEYCWNIIVPHGFAFCDVTNYSLMKPIIFCHIDKHLCMKTTILLFESLYLFVQMVLVICNINVGGF
jgi:hypothetical protein